MIITTRITAEKSGTTPSVARLTPAPHRSVDFLAVIAALLAPQKTETIVAVGTAKGEPPTKTLAGRSGEKQKEEKKINVPDLPGAAQTESVEKTGNVPAMGASGVDEPALLGELRQRETSGTTTFTSKASSARASGQAAALVDTAEQKLPGVLATDANYFNGGDVSCGRGENQGEDSIAAPAIAGPSESQSTQQAGSELQPTQSQPPVLQCAYATANLAAVPQPGRNAGHPCVAGSVNAAEANVDDGGLVSAVPPQWRHNVETAFVQTQKLLLQPDGNLAGDVATAAPTDGRALDNDMQDTAVSELVLSSHSVVRNAVSMAVGAPDCRTAPRNENAQSVGRELLPASHTAKLACGQVQAADRRRSESRAADRSTSEISESASAATTGKHSHKTPDSQLPLMDDKSGVNRSTRPDETRSASGSLQTESNETVVEVPGSEAAKPRVGPSVGEPPPVPSGARAAAFLGSTGTPIDVAQKVRQLPYVAAAQASIASPNRLHGVIEQDGRADVRISIRTTEIGRLELRATAAQGHLSAALSVESQDLRKALIADLGGLHHALAEQRVEAPQITVAETQGGASAGAGDESSQHGHQHDFKAPFQQREPMPHESVSSAEEDEGVIEHIGLDINV